MGTVKNVLTLVQIPLNDSSYFNQSLGEKCSSSASNLKTILATTKKMWKDLLYYCLVEMHNIIGPILEWF